MQLIKVKSISFKEKEKSQIMNLISVQPRKLNPTRVVPKSPMSKTQTLLANHFDFLNDALSKIYKEKKNPKYLDSPFNSQPTAHIVCTNLSRKLAIISCLEYII